MKTTELSSVINDTDTPDAAYQKINALEAAKLLAESDSFELKKQQLQGQNEALQQLSADHNNSLTEIAQSSAEARKKIDDLEYDNKLKLYSGISAAGNAASDLLGQNTIASKSLAVAASLINTYSAIAGQLKAFAGVPIPGYTIAQAVATGIAGFAAVKNILAVKVPAKGGSGNTSGVSGLNAAPVINSTVLADKGTQDVRLSNDTINVKSDTTLSKAYIVDKEITNREEEKAFIERTKSV
ncbi:hypothetical protein [Pedobacter steynii]